MFFFNLFLYFHLLISVTKDESQKFLAASDNITSLVKNDAKHTLLWIIYDIDLANFANVWQRVDYAIKLMCHQCNSCGREGVPNDGTGWAREHNETGLGHIYSH